MAENGRKFVPEDLVRDLKFSERYKPMMILALGTPDKPIILEENEVGQPTAYSRDENNVLHHIRKRKL